MATVPICDGVSVVLDWEKDAGYAVCLQESPDGIHSRRTESTTHGTVPEALRAMADMVERVTTHA